MTRSKKKAVTKNVKETVQTEQPAPQVKQAPPTINVGDLGFAAQYIDVAFRRGAFQASEAAEVGALYNKLASFVAAYNEQVEAAKKTGEEKGE